MTDPERTPTEFYPETGWGAKREDRAAYRGPAFPSGSKVRQYARMAAAAPGAPMVVGCSADSAMSIYVAAAAEQVGVAAYIYTAARKQRTEAIQYAGAHGAWVAEVAPGYLSQVRAAARERAGDLAEEHGAVVRWDVKGALADAQYQAEGVMPSWVRRVVIPTGSGLTASGVLAGMAFAVVPWIPVLLIAVSKLANESNIRANAQKLTELRIPETELVRTPGAYGKPAAARLPDGTPLDPFYAAKAVPYLRPGDLLWVPGLRPVSAFPASVRAALQI